MICPFCDNPAKWVPNEVIYGKRYGKSYMTWLCKSCDAYVGCHQNTKRPFGTMANAETRKWRKIAHRAIDPIWEFGQVSRKKVYQMLKNKFGHEIHVGESDVETCKKIIKIINDGTLETHETEKE